MLTMNIVEHRYRVDENGCWLWLRALSRGYAIYGRLKVARWMWEQKNGRPFPAGLLARHTCNTRRCINPDHISPGTVAQNSADLKATGHIYHGRQLTKEQVIEIRTSKLSTHKLAKKFGLTYTAIYQARRGITYQDITEA